MKFKNDKRFTYRELKEFLSLHEIDIPIRTVYSWCVDGKNKRLIPRHIIPKLSYITEFSIQNFLIDNLVDNSESGSWLNIG